MKMDKPYSRQENCNDNNGEFPAQRVPGLLFWPRQKFRLGTLLDASLIKKKRNSAVVYDLLQRHSQINLSISGHLRGVDGAGSSLDLPEFQRELTPRGAKRLAEIPSTPTIASDFKTRIHFEAAADPEVNEYVAPDYGIAGDKPYRVTGLVALDEQGKTSQKNAPAYILANVFGITGIRVTCEEMSPMALAGGMESSSVFNVALLAAGSMFSGADLSLADIFSLAVKLENDEFNGSTGGQGNLCCMLGGAYRHIWLSGIKDERGTMHNPYGAFSIQLMPDEELHFLEEHMVLVQAGKGYENGVPHVGRTASLINGMWTDLLRDRDSVGLSLHKKKPALVERYTRSLQKKDFETAVAVINRYVDIRDALARRWINLALDAREGKDVSPAGEILPAYAHRYSSNVFDERNTRFKDCEIIRSFYHNQRESLRSTSFYTLSPIAELLKEARGEGIALMPLGAGGPGANLIGISPLGKKHLQDFLEKRGLPMLTEEGARSIIRGTGTLKGYMPFKVGKEPLLIEGFEKLGLVLPQQPHRCFYDEESATFIDRP